MPYVKFDATNLTSRIAAVPLILCGPILRRVSATSVTVWVALKRRSDVTLTIYDADTPRFASTPATPSKIGEHLYVVAVTATAPKEKVLVRGTIYGYDLSFDIGGLGATGVYSQTGGLSALSYATYTRPTFVIPPGAWRDLHFLHGSCRKIHAQGLDALPAADVAIAQWATDAAYRPQFLLMAGDQIYADDVASSVLFMLRDIGATLLGRVDTLPGIDAAVSLEPGRRATVVIEKLFLTTKEESARNHLLHFYEFCAMYIMAWSDVFWPRIPADFPTYKNVFGVDPDPAQQSSYAEELGCVIDFGKTLADVRKVLANISCYMIFDDHEVTDDWYISADWCARVLGNDAGRKLIQNALCAYGVFQAWGNTPEQFDVVGAPGQKLLLEIAKGTGASSTLLDWFLAIPPKAQIFDPSIYPNPNPTKDTSLTQAMKQTLPKVPVLHRPPPSPGSQLDWLTWHYSINGVDFQLIVLDTRTWRSYPGPSGFSPPQLLSDAAWATQVGNDATLPSGKVPELTFVVSPAAPLGVPVVEYFQENRSQRNVLKNDVEGWNGQTRSFQLLLSKFASRATGSSEAPPLHRRIVILSGDVHHAFAIRIQYWASKPYEGNTLDTQAVFALLTASACKNQHDGLTDTIGLHDHGYEIFYMANKRDWINYFGWENPTKARTNVGKLLMENKIDGDTWWLRRETPSVQCLERELAKNYGGTKGRAKLGMAPEWRYAVHYRDSSVIEPVPTTPINSPGKQSVASAHQQHRRYIYSQAAGMQIVGRNNLGEITFRFEGDGTQMARIGQRLWWREPQTAGPTGRTFHIVSLEFNDPEFPDPMTKIVP